MDRNQILGLILMLGLLAIYFQFFAPEPVPPPTEGTEIPQDSTQATNISPSI
jgi:hypothetical protein